jgi:hypothetical protein
MLVGCSLICNTNIRAYKLIRELIITSVCIYIE